MCGFIFSESKKVDEAIFKKGLNSIYHRGPDDVEYKKVSDVYLGFSRLAIMDPTHSGESAF